MYAHSIPSEVNLPPSPPFSVHHNYSHINSHADEIAKGVFVGPLTIFKDSSYLDSHPNIRLLISLTDKNLAPALFKHKYSNSLVHKCLSYDPSVEICKVSQLYGICKTISLCMAAAGGSISCLIFCEDGNRISALVGVCYLIYSRGWSVAEALNTVKEHRRSVEFTEEDVKVLVTFWDICIATKRVESSGGSSNKQSRDRDDEDDYDYEILSRKRVR